MVRELVSAILRDPIGGTSIILSTAKKQGGEMQKSGASIAEVVHQYRGVRECIADLISARASTITNEEIRAMHRCLDDAIAAAVTEFLRLRDHLLARNEIERFAALAHELRNLLNAALLAYHMLREGTARSGDRTTGVLGRSLMGLREIINRSLASARVASGMQQRERILLEEMIDEVEASATLEAAARGAHLSVAKVPRGVLLDVDRLVLESAISNLLTNAFKYSQTNGHVILRFAASHGGVDIEIEDECGGLSAAAMEKLFRPFERRSKDRTGLGLGLAISRQGVEANGGTLDVRNLPRKGCVFRIHLPGAPNDRRGAGAHHAPEL